MNSRSSSAVRTGMLSLREVQPVSFRIPQMLHQLAFRVRLDVAVELDAQSPETLSLGAHVGHDETKMMKAGSGEIASLMGLRIRVLDHLDDFVLRSAQNGLSTAPRMRTDLLVNDFVYRALDGTAGLHSVNVNWREPSELAAVG